MRCQTGAGENAGDVDESDSPGNFTGPSLLWLSVFLSPSELCENLKCQSRGSSLPAAYTKQIQLPLPVWVLALCAVSARSKVLRPEKTLVVSTVHRLGLPPNFTEVRVPGLFGLEMLFSFLNLFLPSVTSCSPLFCSLHCCSQFLHIFLFFRL